MFRQFTLHLLAKFVSEGCNERNDDAAKTAEKFAGNAEPTTFTRENDEYSSITNELY